MNTRRGRWIMSADGIILESEVYRRQKTDQYGAPNFDEPEGWHCPYCGKEMPSGMPDPSVWECCGEVGHAINSEGEQ